MVAVVVPPMTAIASGVFVSDPPKPIAVGIIANTVVAAVISTGLNLSEQPLIIASLKLNPSLIKLFTLSIRIFP